MEADHAGFLREAARLAREGVGRGDGGPFGAVVVREGRIVGSGWNRVVACNDPTAHAEMEAIREACSALGRFHLDGCVLYTSCEPCPMCLAAIHWARLDAVHYALDRDDAAGLGFDDARLFDVLRQPRIPMTRHDCEEALAAFDAWKSKSDKTPY